MARKNKFPESLLLESVERYHASHPGLITVSALVRFAQEEIQGLEEVDRKAYCRPQRKKDPRTGDVVEEPTRVMERIDVINAEEKKARNDLLNPLLTMEDINDFFALPVVEQRAAILSLVESYRSQQQAYARQSREMLLLGRQSEGQLAAAEKAVDLADLKHKIDHAYKIAKKADAEMDKAMMEQVFAQKGICKDGVNASSFEEHLRDLRGKYQALQGDAEAECSPVSDPEPTPPAVPMTKPMSDIASLMSLYSVED